MSLLIVIGSVLAASPPRATKSKYLITTGAGFVFEAGKGARYSLTYALRTAPLPDLYVVGIFDNPEDPAAPLRIEEKIDSGLADFSLSSPFFHHAKNNAVYAMEFSTYTDEEHFHFVATHKQMVRFYFAPTSAAEIKRRYDVEY